jgi:hypothetical protein
MADLPAPQLPADLVDVLVSDLLSVDVQPAYDKHHDILTLLPAQLPEHGCARP